MWVPPKPKKVMLLIFLVLAIAFLNNNLYKQITKYSRDLTSLEAQIILLQCKLNNSLFNRTCFLEIILLHSQSKKLKSQSLFQTLEDFMGQIPNGSSQQCSRWCSNKWCNKWCYSNNNNIKPIQWWEQVAWEECNSNNQWWVDILKCKLTHNSWEECPKCKTTISHQLNRWISSSNCSSSQPCLLRIVLQELTITWWWWIQMWLQGVKAVELVVKIHLMSSIEKYYCFQ